MGASGRSHTTTYQNTPVLSKKLHCTPLNRSARRRPPLVHRTRREFPRTGKLFVPGAPGPTFPTLVFRGGGRPPTIVRSVRSSGTRDNGTEDRPQRVYSPGDVERQRAHAEVQTRTKLGTRAVLDRALSQPACLANLSKLGSAIGRECARMQG